MKQSFGKSVLEGAPIGNKNAAGSHRVVGFVAKAGKSGKATVTITRDGRGARTYKTTMKRANQAVGAANKKAWMVRSERKGNIKLTSHYGG